MLQPSSIAYSNTLLCVLMQLVFNTLVNVLLEYVTRSMFCSSAPGLVGARALEAVGEVGLGAGWGAATALDG